MNAKDFAFNLSKILTDLAKDMNSKEVLQQFGDQAVEIIKKRTKLGYGVAQHGGIKSPLKPLKPNTQEARRKKTLHSSTTPNKSNLTETGDMLNNLTAKVGTDKVTIGFDDTSIEKQAGFVSEDRPFNHLSLAEIEQLRKKIENKAEALAKALNSKQ